MDGKLVCTNSTELSVEALSARIILHSPEYSITFGKNFSK
jgi:hypothetical protein